jgi:hypothetical protein
MRSNQLRLWRGANTVVMLFAMLIPWYFPGLTIEGEIPPNSSTFSIYFEWVFFIINVGDSAFASISHGRIDGFVIELILRGVGALLLLLYLAYNLLVLLRMKKEHKSRIAIPAVLVGIFFVFLSKLRFVPSPMLGFWLISFSLLSSAVLEWVSARQVNTIGNSTG